MTTHRTNGWSEYQKLVIYRLDEQDKKIEGQDKKLDQLLERVNSLRTSMALTKLKLALIGTVSGSLGAALITALAQKWFK